MIVSISRLLQKKCLYDWCRFQPPPPPQTKTNKQTIKNKTKQKGEKCDIREDFPDYMNSYIYFFNIAESGKIVGKLQQRNVSFLSIYLVQSQSHPHLKMHILSRKLSFLSCNLQFFSELITTQLRDFHMVSSQVAFPYLPHHAKLQVLPNFLFALLWYYYCYISTITFKLISENIWLKRWLKKKSKWIVALFQCLFVFYFLQLTYKEKPKVRSFRIG